MDDFKKIFPEELYHSYVIEGSPVITTQKLISLLKMRGEIEDKSPNLLIQSYESFGMESSGQIKEWHSQLAFGQGKKICIIATKFINHEAEESLLKIIEEPGLNTHFFIILPDSSTLLPTLLSRVQIIKDSEVGQEEIELEEVANSFISLKTKDRMTLIDNFIKDKTDQDNSGKLRRSATILVNLLESIFYLKFKEDILDSKNINILDNLRKSRDYLKRPGSSVKYILQNLALLI